MNKERKIYEKKDGNSAVLLNKKEYNSRAFIWPRLNYRDKIF